MKKFLLIFVLLILSIVVTSETFDSGSSFDARINTYKQECKTMIKPARYEGSRITYYAPSKEKQIKNIETFFIIDTEYILAFSGKECSTKLNVRIYDSNSENRTLLKELKGIQGKNVSVSSTDLTKTFHKKVNKNERLKVVFVEYEIASGALKNEAIVLVVGYKD